MAMRDCLLFPHVIVVDKADAVNLLMGDVTNTASPIALE